MKNYVPLVLAVLLGLAAVLAVGKLIGKQDQGQVKTVAVIAASRDISPEEELTEDALAVREIPEDALPAQYVGAGMKAQLIGQTVWRSIPNNDFVLLTDLKSSRTMVGMGEWAVALDLGADGIAALVQPGDEVAIIGTVGVLQKVQSADLSAPQREEPTEATVVLFPKVRVLALGAKGPGELILGLAPKEAQFLIAAQQKFTLTLALRRPGDGTAVDRVEIGKVDAASFNQLLPAGMKSVVLPSVPGAALGVEKK